MNTYLLTWNPEKWNWNDLSIEAARVRSGEEVEGQWSTGVTRRIDDGDNLFLLRQGKDRKGVIARAVASGRVFEDKHFSDPKKTALFVPFVFRELIDPEFDAPLPVRDLVGILSEKHWNSQSSGISIAADAAEKLNDAWQAHLRRLGYGNVLRIGATYTRENLYTVLKIPREFQGGDWGITDTTASTLFSRTSSHLVERGTITATIGSEAPCTGAVRLDRRRGIRQSSKCLLRQCMSSREIATAIRSDTKEWRSLYKCRIQRQSR